MFDYNIGEENDFNPLNAVNRERRNGREDIKKMSSRTRMILPPDVLTLLRFFNILIFALVSVRKKGKFRGNFKASRKINVRNCAY